MFTVRRNQGVEVARGLLFAAVLALSLSFANVAHGQVLATSPQSKAGYCSMTKTPARFLNLAASSESRIAFQNPNGYFSTGLCWWHSHLQRAAIYLTYYDPASPKPTASQAYGLLQNLYFNHAVTRIPGYHNFNEFTQDNEKLVTDFLSDVEILATAGGDWIHGVIGHSQVSATNLKQKMDSLYTLFHAQPALVYQMLQMPGADAHAWLVQSITPRAGGGYDLNVIDSNFPTANSAYSYAPGQTEFTYPDDTKFSFVPYTYDQFQINKFAASAASFCR